MRLYQGTTVVAQILLKTTWEIQIQSAVGSTTSQLVSAANAVAYAGQYVAIGMLLDSGTTTSNGANNYLVGGGGDDILEGLGGDDFIFGDSMIVDNNLYNQLDSRYGAGHAAFTGTTTQWGEVRTTYADGTKGHILGDSGTAGTNDTVVFSGDFEDYTFELVVYVDEFAVAHNAVRVIDGVAGRDGTDVVVDVESFKFANGVKTFAQVLPPPTASVNDVSVTEGDSGSVNATFTFTLRDYRKP